MYPDVKIKVFYVKMCIIYDFFVIKLCPFILNILLVSTLSISSANVY